MLIDKWTPYRELGGLHSEMNRLFNNANLARAKRPSRNSSAWNPPVDIWEKDTGVGLRMELAGIAKDDIDVNVEDGVLTVSGEKRFRSEGDAEDEKRSFRRVESSYGSFERQFVLPDRLDPSSIEASYKDGVLELSIARREESLPKKVDVTIQ